MEHVSNLEVRESRDWAWGLQLMHDLREKVTDDAGAKAMWQTSAELEARKDLRLIEVWNGERLGAFVLADIEPGTVDLHTLLKVGGHKAVKAGAAMLAHAFGPLGIERIIGRCPGNNPAILHYAKLNGFRVMGHRKDWVKHGKRYVSTYVELSKQDWEKQKGKALCQ